MGLISKNRGPCQVCHNTETTRRHFGIISCTACAAFFRRSIGMQYLCTAENRCTISFDRKFFCRACRYASCLKAGMKLELIRKQKNNIYLRFPDAASNQQNLVRDSMSPATSEGGQSSSSKTDEESDDPEYSKILKMYHDDLLQYYVKEVKKMMAEKRRGCEKNTLQIKTISDLMLITARQSGPSMEECLRCPGVDMLEKEDVEALLRYYRFSNIWVDSVLIDSVLESAKGDSHTDTDDRLSRFIQEVKSTLGSSLAHLNLNIYEFAAFKALCIWKLRFYETSFAQKIIAHEHYEGVTGALRNYYENCTELADMEIAIRIGDITLQIVTVQNTYHEMVRLYYQIGMPL
ncbi:Nuclear receptor domain-containing protein [Caenorhabditis elegans]|uniref:Nuclear receptor domain-containing protein n=1 Tax=Caenorhabditis elegans TaxID=6239 RepID=O62116_CAEEL|nr:Nuclear receptor domain-containing protein [Caenorhabditis elegans]CAA15840.2 Nuclear receptor domain-containing protein [Caenorhabditis elegans]|eukprot:NP_493118.2 Nuclear Hormone Receptor family [Caenorhabditis elegans]